MMSRRSSSQQCPSQAPSPARRLRGRSIRTPPCSDLEKLNEKTTHANKYKQATQNEHKGKCTLNICKVRISYGYLGAHQSRAWTNVAAGGASTTQVASGGVTRAAGDVRRCHQSRGGVRRCYQSRKWRQTVSPKPQSAPRSMLSIPLAALKLAPPLPGRNMTAKSTASSGCVRRGITCAEGGTRQERSASDSAAIGAPSQAPSRTHPHVGATVRSCHKTSFDRRPERGCQRTSRESGRRAGSARWPRVPARMRK